MLQNQFENIFLIFVLLFWLKSGLNQVIFICILPFCIDDVLLEKYFIEMLNPLPLKADSYCLFAHSNLSSSVYDKLEKLDNCLKLGGAGLILI